ncbi:MAG: RNA pyrophosphohydrolase [Pseudomonadota bacterium]
MSKKLTADDLPYRPCVGVVVFNSVGKVWAGRRTPDNNTEYSGSPKLWQFPQGGIDEGEDPRAAGLRELYEETGIESVELLEEVSDWLHYDLPEDLIGIGLKGKFRGQKQRWFAYRFTGEEDEIQIAPPPDGHAQEFDDWAWRELFEMPDLIVEFKQGIYEELASRLARHAGPSV